MKILASNSNKGTGINVYSDNVAKYLSTLCNVNVSWADSSEFKIGDSRVGGIIKPLAKSFFTKTSGYDIVHSLDMHLIHPSTNVVSLLDLIPILNSKDCQAGSIRKVLFSYLLKWLRKMDRIITISNTVADNASCILGIDRDRFVTAYCGIDHDMFFPSENRPFEMTDDKINLLFVGDLRVRKNVHLILEAMKLLGGSYRLIRIGSSRMPSYKQRCYNYAMRNNIDFVDLGYVPSERLKDYYSFADLFVFPSNSEGFGMPPMEALACGTPCVLSNIPVFKEIYKGMVFFSELNAVSLSNQIKEATNHNSDKKKLMKFAQEFTWKKTAKNILKVYEGIKK